jgi:hypothetical protein
MAAVMNALFRTAIVIAVVLAAWLQHIEEQEHAAARRAFREPRLCFWSEQWHPARRCHT